MNKTNQLKVLLVRNAYHWQYGGAERFSYNLAKELKHQGIATTVSTRVPELIEQLSQSGIPVIKNLWLKNANKRRFLPLYLLSPILVLQYWLLIKAHGIQLVILGSRDDQIFGTLAAKLAGIPAVWIDHADMKHILQKNMLSGLYRYALDRCDKVIVVSQAEKKLIEPHLSATEAAKLVVINNGATRSDSQPPPNPTGARIVSYIGRIEEDKGVFDLIEAAKSVLAKHSDVEFWLAGKGSDEDAAKELVSGHGLDRIKFIGHLDNVGSLLQISTLFVYPTHHDASPLAPVEAMLYGVPVVATDVGGIPEVVDTNSGVLVPSGDIKALSQAVDNLLCDKTKLQSLSTGAKQSGSRLELSNIVKDRYLPLLKELAK